MPGLQLAPQNAPLAAVAPSASARDHAVDLIKGVACLLMVVAHVPFPHFPWLAQATLGSVLFFASTGMNFGFLLDHRPGDEARIAANACFLVFAGFANNFVQGTLWQSDVFQSAGMALLAMLLLRRLLPAFWTWLFPLPFLLHWLNQHVLYWKTSAGGVSSFFLTPGLFPLLPWLSFYMLGAHLRRYNQSRMRIACVLAALLGLAALLAWKPFDFNKFWMSPDYWLLGIALPPLALELARRGLAARVRIPWAEVRYWGANSLVFYLLHSFSLKLLEIWVPTGWRLLALGLLLTATLLRAGLALQRRVQRRPALAMLAASAGLATAVLVAEALVLRGFYARTFASFGVTLAFLTAYPAWKNLTRRLRRSQRPGSGRPPVTSLPRLADASGAA